MSKELNEAIDKIKDLRDLFINECKSGSWKEYGGNRYINQYFELNNTKEYSQNPKWIITFDRERIFPEEINISKIYFYYLRTLVKRSAKNNDRNNRYIQIGRISDRFFNEHKELKRDSKLDKLLN